MAFFRLIGGLIGGLLCALMMASPAHAEPVSPASTQLAGKQVRDNQVPDKQVPDIHFTSAQLSKASDSQLTDLAAHWGRLAPGQRRVLLAEMRTRMARSQSQSLLFNRKGEASVQRQYGRVIREVRKTRQPDGSILVETRVVRVRPKGEPQPASQPAPGTVPGNSARVTFGVGFERRQQKPQAAQPLPKNGNTSGNSAEPSP